VPVYERKHAGLRGSQKIKSSEGLNKMEEYIKQWRTCLLPKRLHVSKSKLLPD
jgi:hypothetical protein